MIFYTFFILLFNIRISSSICLKSNEYLDHNICVPCTKCRPPLITISACTRFRDTYCGPSAFIKQSDSPFEHDGFLLKNTEINTIRNGHTKDFRKQPKPFRRKKLKCDRLKNKHKREMCRKMKQTGKTNPLHSVPAADNMLHSEIGYKAYDVEANLIPVYANIAVNVTKASTTINKEEETFWTKYEVKLSIIISFISFDTILILVLIFLFCKHCRRNSKSENRENGQKLPNPSNTPVKCRFTAVLPANAPQCLNDSPASTLLRNNRTQHQDSGSMSQYSLACSHPDYHQTDFVNSYPDSSLSLPRSNPHSTFHPRETASHYAQPPNSYVMDRLLAENRNGEGHMPMENNVYVETWYNRTSPMPPEVCDNSVPFFAGFQAPTNYASRSSPIMLRTYRET